MRFPNAIVFDLDKTLSESKLPMTATMAARVSRLLARISVAITSGQKLAQLESQAAVLIPEDLRGNLFLLPTSGAALYRHRGGTWEAVYKETLSEEEAAHVMRVVEATLRDAGTLFGAKKPSGPILEHRDGAVAFSALGQNAALVDKKLWDPDQKKRHALRNRLLPLLPEYEVRIAGTTTIDINKKGIDKAHGVRELAVHLGFSVTDMLYVGDDLGPGGNDEVVIQTGIPTRAVRNPDDTAALIDFLLTRA